MTTMQYGIDLGTTNSCIARVEDQDVRVFQNNDQMSVTPSAVHILRNGRVIVGKRAYNAIVTDPDNVAIQFKRWIGQRDTVRFPASGREMTPEELSAEVLKSLKADVGVQTGDDIRTAVITVPAAFATLQCEATSRAAKLAGVEECVLLQEPIAAAVAYGVKPGARDQRWMVFDLGGGTLDIALISTRDGRLTVVEHSGRNLLGGKDIDRLIAERIFLPALAEAHPVPDPQREQETYRYLYRRLLVRAEQEKIALSTVDAVEVYFDDLGKDATGRPFDLAMTFRRSDLERVMGPLLDKCLQLSEETIERARWNGADLDRILLVGGPTQMPVLRTALAHHIGAPVDFSLDPMTVVARGAAIFATTVEPVSAAASVVPVPAVEAKPVISLAYEKICPDVECPVTCKVEHDPGQAIAEIKVDAEGGYWTSGWLPVASDGFCEVLVRLQQGKRSQRFTLGARDGAGRLIEIKPSGFAVDHGLALANPPLPQTISVEVLTSDGRRVLEPIFRRNTPLPAEAEKRLAADRTLRPDDPDSLLAVKLWEGEDFEEPEANQWLAALCIRGRQFARPVPEGTGLLLNIRIDESRRISVDVFIEYLNVHVSYGVYLPEDSGRLEPPGKNAFDQTLERLERVEEALLSGAGDEEDWEELNDVRKKLIDAEEDMHAAPSRIVELDPDWKARIDELLRELRARIARVEKRGGISTLLPDPSEVDAAAEATVRIAEKHGTPLEQREAQFLRGDLERSGSRNDERGLRKATEDLRDLYFRIVTRQPEFWKNLYRELQDPHCRYKNRREANRWFAAGQQAIEQDDLDGLREAVRQLFELQEPDDAEKIRDRALPPGLRVLIERPH